MQSLILSILFAVHLLQLGTCQQEQRHQQAYIVAAAAAAADGGSDDECGNELQTIQCSAIPFKYTADRITCCNLYATPDLGTGQHTDQASMAVASLSHPTALGTAEPAPKVQSHNFTLVTDPGSSGGSNASQPDLDEILTSNRTVNQSQITAHLHELYAAGCMDKSLVSIPMFVNDSASTEQINAHIQSVPQLNSGLIQRIKARALSQIKSIAAARPIWKLLRKWDANHRTVFKHPGVVSSAAELVLMQHRLSQGAPVQAVAVQQLLTGAGVPPKMYEGPTANWSVPVNTSLDYQGPYAMAVLLAKYGGVNDAQAGGPCPANYPVGAPTQICGHVSLVELDGQEVYKQALAYVATGDARHAGMALKLLDNWAATNTVFGLLDGNGALEAAWACSSMSKAMELLLHGKGLVLNSTQRRGGRRDPWVGVSDSSLWQFVSWVGDVLMPVMDAWVAQKTPDPRWRDDGNMLANWHASIGECWMSFGVLTDDRARYDRGVALFHSTVKGYFKWGRGHYSANRLIGESTETLRDIYHTLFGLGSLLQAAETAWQQDDDLYSSNNHVLAAAMEVHARIINAGRNESLLPPNFKLFESMPPPPDGCYWRINLGSQLWNAINKTSGAVVSELRDGFKYVLGSKYLPTAWEIGYNHYAGRLGLHLPETAALLARNWPEYYSFCWGLSTLTHADSAALLWQPGLIEEAACH